MPQGSKKGLLIILAVVVVLIGIGITLSKKEQNGISTADTQATPPVAAQTTNAAVAPTPTLAAPKTEKGKTPAPTPVPAATPVKSEAEAKSAPAPTPTSVVAGPTPPSTPKSSKGEYNAECLSSTGMMLGVVTSKDSAPEKLKVIPIKNRNTGKVTEVKASEARCTFTPVK